MIEGSPHISTICRGFNGSYIQFHPILCCIKEIGPVPYTRICIADVKVYMQMQMHSEWPCP